MDGSPRSAKRQRTDSTPPQFTLPTLLLSLPALLLHPPTHPSHEPSLALSYHALSKCIAITSLDRVVECRALTALAELGIQIGPASRDIQNDIQKAITKASLVAQNLPSLQLYRTHLVRLSSQLALASGNAKAAQNNLKRSLTNLTHTDPPHVLYATHLALIASISSQGSDETSNTMRSLGAINDLHELASKRAHQHILQLVSVLRLRALMRSGLWNEVGESLDAAESVLHMRETLETRADDKGKTPETPALTRVVPTGPPSPPSSVNAPTRSSFEYALIIHTLILGVIFHTYTGDSSLANPRLKWLHELLDLQLPHFPKTGIFEIPFANAPPLYYQLTHPRIIYVLGFLVSSLAKRDLVGRKPKKKVFATEGINAVDKELGKELAFPTWASIYAVQEADYRLKKIRADLMCELIGACIIRSEFDSAERSIDELISYTRTHNIFPSYVARITLHEAQLAHALNKPKRALQCYQVAAWLSRKRSGQPQQHRGRTSHIPDANADVAATAMLDTTTDGEEDPWINAAARAGELWLRIGLVRRMVSSTEGEEDREKEMEELRRIGVGVTRDCREFGGTLEAIAEVLEGCLTKEFVKAKTHLRRALNLSTTSQDNHLRALVLSFIASHYLHTSNQNAEKMLETAENLAAGLCAQPKQAKAKVQVQVQGPDATGINSKSTLPGSSLAGGDNANDGMGNVHLRLWIGERFLELYNRAGNEEGARVQAAKNKRLVEAVGRTEVRG